MTAYLYDYATAEKIGPATDEQIEASYDEAAGHAGANMIDADGNVVEDGAWAAQQPGVRTVYVQGAEGRE